MHWLGVPHTWMAGVMQFAGGCRRVGRSVRLHPWSRGRLLRVPVLPWTTQQTSQAISFCSSVFGVGVDCHHRQTQ